MIKYFLIILLFLTQFSFAQTRPTGFPTQLNTGWQRWGYSQSDSGTIIAKRDTNWFPRFTGTVVMRPQDRTFYYYDSTDLRWYLLSGTPSDSSFYYVDYIPQTTNPSYNEGRLFYDDVNKTLTLFDAISGTSLQIGQEQYVRARNNTGSQINDGSVVYISGATGQTPTVALALANSISTTSVLGIATHNISNNSVGKITTFGLVNDINTSSFSAGDKLYLSPTTPGGITNVEPDVPNFSVFVGYCLNSHINQGKIFVSPVQRVVQIHQLNDTSFVSIVGTIRDTIRIVRANNNIGSGYRWAVPNTNNIKTVFASNTILWDSTSNSNALTPKADTSVLATQHDILARNNNANLDSVLSLGGRLSANRSVSMGHKRWDLDSAVLRLRNVDSSSIGIDLAKQGEFLRLNFPNNYVGIKPFQMFGESSSNGDGTFNPVWKVGFNVDRVFNSSLSGQWLSMESDFRPGGALFKEFHYVLALPNGQEARLLSSTAVERSTLFLSENNWDIRGNSINFSTLTDTAMVGISRGHIDINAAGIGNSFLTLTNSADVVTLRNQTGVLEIFGLPVQTEGEINFTSLTNSASGRGGYKNRTPAGTAYWLTYGNSYSDASLRGWTLLTGQNGSLTGMMAIDNIDKIILGDQTAYTPVSEKVQFFGDARGRAKFYWDTPDSLTTTPPNIAYRDPSNGQLRIASYPSFSDSGIWKNNVTMDGDHTMNAGTNTWTINGSAAFADGAQFDVITSGSVGIAIRGQSTDGRGVMGLATTGVGVYGSATGADGYGLFGISSGTGGNAIYGSTTSGLVLQGVMNPTSTSTVIPAISLTRAAQSAGANGIGQSIDFYNHTSTTDELANQLISKWTDATNATRTSQFSIVGVNSASTQTIATFAGDGTYTTIGRRIIAVTVSSAGTLTLGNSHSYIFSGTTTTWTLPAVSGTTGVIYYIKNRGSGSITLNANAAANEIYSTSAVSTYEITAGSAIILISDGQYFTVN